MTKVKAGDRVRATFEGTATPQCDGGVLVQEGGYSAFVPLTSVEVLKPPVKVGDVVDTALHTDDHFPNGSVIVTGEGPVWVKRGKHDWVPATDRDSEDNGGDFALYPDTFSYVAQECGLATVVHLPKSS